MILHAYCPYIDMPYPMTAIKYSVAQRNVVMCQMLKAFPARPPTLERFLWLGQTAI